MEEFSTYVKGRGGVAMPLPLTLPFYNMGRGVVDQAPSTSSPKSYGVYNMKNRLTLNLRTIPKMPRVFMYRCMSEDQVMVASVST
jgi:hypothetical protein